MLELAPYLFFKGNCREAMEFYKGVFGGELTVQTHGEAMGEHADPKMADKIMHARLDGGEVVLMGTDDMGDIPKESARISLSLAGDDEAKLRKIWDDLAEGGEVKHQLEKQFWGDNFGDLRDKYGMSWMVNINAQKS